MAMSICLLKSLCSTVAVIRCTVWAASGARQRHLGYWSPACLSLRRGAREGVFLVFRIPTSTEDGCRNRSVGSALLLTGILGCSLDTNCVPWSQMLSLSFESSKKGNNKNNWARERV